MHITTFSAHDHKVEEGRGETIWGMDKVVTLISWFGHSTAVDCVSEPIIDGSNCTCTYLHKALYSQRAAHRN